MPAQLSEPNRLGVGLYSVPDAARLIKVSSQQVRRWIDPQDGLIQRVLSPDEQTITFLELMELHFVKMFREAGVSLQTVRRAATTAARHFECAYPFTIHRFDSDGRTIFATLIKAEKKRKLIEDLQHGQYVFETIVRPFFKKLEYHQDDPVRFWPMGHSHRVVLDPRRQFGKPIDAASGVPTRALFRAVIAGDDPSTVATWFNVSAAAVAAAVKFEESLAA
jgi:uncharacterized protein (DUF433 family)/DNA-binding transcriptional MerR regulator